MNDIFKDYGNGLQSPGFDAAEVTPSNTTDLPITSRALYVGSGGSLRVTMAGGATVTFVGVAAGILPLRIARVHASGTSASDIVAIW